MKITKTELLQRMNDGQTDFDGVDLSGQDLDDIEINGGKCMMRGANFEGATLRDAKIIELQLSGANFQRANLEGATFQSCVMVGTDLYGAVCRRARFIGGFLDRSCLISTDLRESLLVGTDWSEVLLGFTDLRGAVLAELRNLEQVKVAELPAEHHQAFRRTHANVDIDFETLEKSAELQRVLSRDGAVDSSFREVFPQFLATLGVNKLFIGAYASMLELPDTDLQSVFISYSSHDQAFADRLYDELKRAGVRTWYAPRNMKAGQQIHDQIKAAIQRHDRVLLVLSQNSIGSTWVSTELTKAYEREITERTRVLFPISLVSYNELTQWELFDADRGTDLARYVRRYFIPDFSDWRSDHSFKEQTARLINDLRLDASTT